MEKITEEMNFHQAWYAEARKMTVDELPTFIKKLSSDYSHDYGTICHAIAAAAVGAAWAVEHSPQGGITGFQGSAVMWEFIKHWDGLKGPARLLRYEDMLYPQYEHNYTAISKETWAHLQKKARELLAEKEPVAGAVEAHWKSIIAGNIPFGFRLED